MEDQQYWLDLIKNTGYTLYGWNGKITASFHTPDGKFVQITQEHLNLIDAIIKARRLKTR